MAWEDRNVRYPRWSSPGEASIDVTYDSPKWGSNLDCTLVPNSGDEVMQELWDDCLAGKFGVVLPYQPV